MDTTRKVTTLGVSLLLASGVALAGATPASAAQEPCREGSFCFWDRPNWRGDGHHYWGKQLQPGVRFGSAAYKASSMWNRTNEEVRVFANYDCYGSSLTWIIVLPGQKKPDLRGEFNDVAASAKFVFYGYGC